MNSDFKLGESRRTERRVVGHRQELLDQRPRVGLEAVETVEREPRLALEHRQGLEGPSQRLVPAS
jgi:hypothetical protein